MSRDDEEVQFVKEGENIYWCKGRRLKHNPIPVVLFKRPSGVLRRGICKGCGTVYVSMTPREKQD